MKSPSRKPHPEPRSKSKSGNPISPGRPPLSRGRLWLFRIMALSILPVLLLVVECGLRLGGYGYRTDFFLPLKIGEKDFLVQNNDFGLRFFPKEISRKPEPIRMPAVKPPGTFRIFVLGESAALGDPEPAYGAGRYLEVLLRERFPNTEFEVVNVAFTAINSHVILPIARDCARQKGDVWIIYMGNNEMVGPFGAATVFGAQAPSRTFVQLGTGIQKLRVGQLLTAWARKLGGRSAKASAWRGMEMFMENRVAPDSPKKERVYQTFDQNLAAIVQTGLDAGAKIILNTMAVNLKDSPPFASMLNSNLAAAARQKFEQSLAQAKQCESQGDYAHAAEFYGQALQQDERFAEAQYRLGSCLLQGTNELAAVPHLQLACDDDALPFRTDTRLNTLIRAAGARYAPQGLLLCDAAVALGTNQPAGVYGREFFYEHVHFNFAGNYQLARLWADAVVKALPSALINRARAEWASAPACEQRLGLTEWNRVFVIESMLERLQQPLLGSQSNNSERIQLLREEAARLRQKTNPELAARAGELYLEAIKKSPEDHLLYENFAKFLESTKNLAPAVRAWKQVLVLLPNNYRANYQAGRLSAALNQMAEAEAFLTAAVKLSPELAEAWFELGNVKLRAERWSQALEYYERAARLEPRNGAYLTFVGKALGKLNRRSEALEQYRAAIKIQPDLWLAHLALGDALASDNQFEEAGREFAEVVRLRPGHVAAHFSLGLVQVKLGRPADARRQFEEVLRHEPTHQAARDWLAQLAGQK